MMKFMKYQLTIIFFLTMNLTEASTCDGFYKSPIISQTLKAVRNSRVVWKNFDPKKFDFALTNIKTYPKCLLVVSSGKLIKLSLQNNLNIKNEAYTFIPTRGEKPESELLLNSIGIEKAIILSIHNFLTDTDLLNYPAKQIGLTTTTLFHELFHKVGQVSNLGWPKWVSELASSGRRDFSNSCHGHEIPALKRERDFLIRAVSNVNNKMVFIKNINSFITAREERYRRNPTCIDKEHAFEMLEGVAEYVGNETVLSQRIFSYTDLYNYIQYNTNNSQMPIPWYYYHLGELQLLAINSIEPNIFINQNPLLLGKTSSDSIFGLLKKTLNN